MSAGFTMAISGSAAGSTPGSTAATTAAAGAAGNTKGCAGDAPSTSPGGFLSTLESVAQRVDRGGGKPDRAADTKPATTASRATASASAPAAAPASAADQAPDAGQAAANADDRNSVEHTDRDTRDAHDEENRKDSKPEAAAAVAATLAQLLAAAQAAIPSAVAVTGDAAVSLTKTGAAPLMGLATDASAAANADAATAAPVQPLAAATATPPTTTGAVNGALNDALSLALSASSDPSTSAGTGKDTGTEAGQSGPDGFKSLTSLLSAATGGATASDFGALLAAPSVQGAAPAAAPTTGTPVDALMQPRLHEPVGGDRWAEELGTRLTLMATRGEQHGALRLSPEHLGPLEVQIHLQDDKASVWFGAAHADTRAALQDALPRLRELFAASGMQLGDAGVSREAPRQARAPGAADNGRPTSGSAREETLVLPAAGVARHLGLLDTYA